MQNQECDSWHTVAELVANLADLSATLIPILWNLDKVMEMQDGTKIRQHHGGLRDNEQWPTYVLSLI